MLCELNKTSKTNTSLIHSVQSIGDIGIKRKILRYLLKVSVMNVAKFFFFLQDWNFIPFEMIHKIKFTALNFHSNFKVRTLTPEHRLTVCTLYAA